MFNWLFKKRSDHIKQLHFKVSNGFSKIWEDMNHVGNWIEHFNYKHDDHNKMFHMINQRLTQLEKNFEKLEQLKHLEKNETIEESEDIELIEDIEINPWDSLTETLQKICWQLAAIQKELPNQWVSLKYLAQEMYPDKSYNQVRSTLSQYISNLEEMGYVKRVRKGKQAYLLSTKKNPCLKKKKKVFDKIKIKNKKKN